MYVRFGVTHHISIDAGRSFHKCRKQLEQRSVRNRSSQSRIRSIKDQLDRTALRRLVLVLLAPCVGHLLFGRLQEDELGIPLGLGLVRSRSTINDFIDEGLVLFAAFVQTVVIDELALDLPRHDVRADVSGVTDLLGSPSLLLDFLRSRRILVNGRSRECLKKVFRRT